jgi:hypothetical protein
MAAICRTRYSRGMRVRYTIRRRRRKAGLRQLFMIGLAVVMFAQLGAMKMNQLQRQIQQSAPPPLPLYATQAECESATDRSCNFVMCDYAPPGKTIEEVCSGLTKGWQAMPDSQQGAEEEAAKRRGDAP